MEKFDLSQIKAGHLLVVKDTERPEPYNMTVSVGVVNSLSGREGLVCCCPGKEWWPVERFNQEGEVVYLGGYARIIAVYGTVAPRQALDNSIEGRKLLWKREPQKMTVTEVCEALGYDVEIVKEGES